MKKNNLQHFSFFFLAPPPHRNIEEDERAEEGWGQVALKLWSLQHYVVKSARPHPRCWQLSCADEDRTSNNHSQHCSQSKENKWEKESKGFFFFLISRSTKLAPSKCRLTTGAEVDSTIALIKNKNKTPFLYLKKNSNTKQLDWHMRCHRLETKNKIAGCHGYTWSKMAVLSANIYIIYMYI